MAYKRKTEGLDPERGDQMTLRNTDIAAVAALPPSIGDPIAGAFVRWFAGGEDKSLADITQNAILQMLKDRQRENVRHYIESCDNKGNGASREKSGEVGISQHKSGELPNETKTENETERKTNENETRTPGTAFVSPSISDSVSLSSSTPPPDPAAVESAITNAADLLGDKKPSRDAWRDFIIRYGLAAFKDQVTAVMRNGKARNKGAYLNTLLEAYTPPPPPPKPKPPKVYTKADWILCEERCENFNGQCCAAGMKIPPEHDPARSHIPEDCKRFKALSETGDRQPPPPDIAAILRTPIFTRTNAKR